VRDRLSEAEARRIWRRAAELQARAADAAARGDLPVPTERTEGLASTEVTAAAVEAGIASEYVQLALAELESGRLEDVRDEGVQKLGRRLVGEPFDGVEAERMIAAAPAETHAVLLRIFTAQPYTLVLTDTRGSTPFVDDVLVFDAEAPSFSQTPFQTKLYFGDVKRLYVMIRPLPDRDDACRVRIRGPFERRRLNLFLGGVFTAVPGLAGTGIGLGIGAALFTAGAGAIATPIAVGLLGAFGGARGFRALYQLGVRQVRRALEQLLGTLAADVQLRRSGLNAGPQASPAGDEVQP
jgi:hypothetical protein